MKQKSIRLFATLLAVIGMSIAATANASFILNLTHDGSNGVIASLSGTGTTSGIINDVAGIFDLSGNPFNASTGIFSLDSATSLIFAPGIFVEKLNLKNVGPGNDDIDIIFSACIDGPFPGCPATVHSSYDASGSSSLPIANVQFANLTVGSYSSTSTEAGYLGGFTLNIIDPFQSAGIPEPTTLALFGLGLAGVGFTWRRKV